MPRGRGARMLGRGGGELWEWDGARPPAGGLRPRGPRPRPPAGGSGPKRGGGGRQVDPMGSWDLAPSRFCPWSPGGVRTIGDVLYPDPVATGNGFSPHRRPRTPGFPPVNVNCGGQSYLPQFSPSIVHREDWWDSGLGTWVLLEGWGSGGRVTIEPSMSTS